MQKDFIIPNIKKYKIFNLKINNKEQKIYGESVEEVKQFIFDNFNPKDDIKLNYEYSTEKKENAEEIAEYFQNIV
ncbi:MAG: hypothetical protein ACOCUI_02295 [bacterium]